MKSEISICNMALRYIGVAEILSFDDGSVAAGVCKARFAIERDELFDFYDIPQVKVVSRENYAEYPDILVKLLARKLAAAVALPLAGSVREEQRNIKLFFELYEIAKLAGLG